LASFLLLAKGGENAETVVGSSATFNPGLHILSSQQQLILLLLASSLFADVELQLPEFFGQSTVTPVSVLSQ